MNLPAMPSNPITHNLTPFLPDLPSHSIPSAEEQDNNQTAINLAPTTDIAVPEPTEVSVKEYDDTFIDEKIEYAYQLIGLPKAKRRELEEEEKNRVEFLKLFLQQYPLPPYMETLTLKDFALFYMMDLFQLLSSRTQMNRKGVQAYVDFLHFIMNEGFLRKNDKRLNELFVFLSKHVNDSKLLANKEVKAKKILLMKLITDPQFEKKTLASLLEEKKEANERIEREKEKEEQPSQNLDEISLCQKLIESFSPFSSQLLEIVEKDMLALNNTLLSGNKKVKNPLTLKNIVPEHIYYEIQKSLLTSNHISCLIRVYQIRRSSFSEAFQKINHFLTFPSPSTLKSASLHFSQAQKTCELLKRQIDSIREKAEKAHHPFSSCISKEEEEEIFEEENEHFFKMNSSSEEFYDHARSLFLPSLRLVESRIELALTSSNRKPLQLLKEENIQGEINKDLGIMLNCANGINFLFQKMTDGLELVLQDIDKEKETTREKTLEHKNSALKKLKKQEQIHRDLYLSEKHRSFCQFTIILNELNHSLELFAKLLEIINRLFVKITPLDQSTGSLLDLLFEDEHKKVIRQRKRPSREIEKIVEEEGENVLDSTDFFTPIQTSVTPEPKEVTSTETPSLRRALETLSMRVTPKQFLVAYQSEDTSEEMVTNAFSYLEDLQDHYQLFSLSLELLKKCLSQNNHLTVFPFLLSRYGSLVGEHALTAHLLLTKEEALLEHDHFNLAHQLGIRPQKENQWLYDYLGIIVNGAVLHRYPHANASRLEAREIPFPGCLKMLLNDRNPDVESLKNLAIETLRFANTFCMGRNHELDVVEQVKDLLDVSSIKKKKGPQKANPLVSELNKSIKPIINRLQILLEESSFIAQKLQGDNLATALWSDVNAHLQGLQDNLSFVLDFPQSRYLGLHGDLILTRCQFLLEQMETSLHLAETGELLTMHDLKAYVELRQEELSGEEARQIAALNIQSNAQYPHRNLRTQFGDNIPEALAWRFEAMKLAKNEKKEDLQIQDALLYEKEGFEQQRKGRKPAKPLQAVSIYRRLMDMTQTYVSLIENRIALMTNSLNKAEKEQWEKAS